MARRRLLPGADARQGLVALALNSSTSLVAGAVLGSLTAHLRAPAGPARPGARGHRPARQRVRLAWEPGVHRRSTPATCSCGCAAHTVLGQNVLAAGVLTLGMSLVLVRWPPWCPWGSASATRSASPTWPSSPSAAGALASLPGPRRHPRAGGGRGAVRLGPGQRHRPPRVHPWRRPHPAGALRGHGRARRSASSRRASAGPWPPLPSPPSSPGPGPRCPSSAASCARRSPCS